MTLWYVGGHLAVEDVLLAIARLDQAWVVCLSSQGGWRVGHQQIMIVGMGCHASMRVR